MFFSYWFGTFIMYNQLPMIKAIVTLLLHFFIAFAHPQKVDIVVGTATSHHRLKNVRVRAPYYSQQGVRFAVINNLTVQHASKLYKDVDFVHPYEDIIEYYERHCYRYIDGPSIIYEHYLNASLSFEWLLFGDDDMLANITNIRKTISKFRLNSSITYAISDDLGGRCHRRQSNYRTSPRCLLTNNFNPGTCDPPIAMNRSCTWSEVFRYFESDCWDKVDGVRNAINVPWGAYGFLLSHATVKALYEDSNREYKIRKICKERILADTGLSHMLHGINIGLSSFAVDLDECAFGSMGRKQNIHQFPSIPNSMTEEFTALGNIWTWYSNHT